MSDKDGIMSDKDNVMSDKDKIFKLVMMAGEILLHNGAEIFRVQETITIIAKAFDVAELDVFIVSNGIFITMQLDGNSYSTRIKYIPIAQIHLGRVEAVNNLSRDIVAGRYTIEEAIRELEEISEIPYSPDLMRVIFAGIGSASFCYILGGSIFDSAVALIAGFLLYIYVIYSEKVKTPKVLKIVFGSAGVTLISSILYSLGLGNSLDHIIIGSIICLVPGVALTTSVRDFFNGDYLSGTIHLVDAILVATSIAVGVGVVLKAWEILL